MMNKIYIAADAKSQTTKQEVEEYLEAHHISYTDLGALSIDDTKDITDIVPIVTRRIISDDATAILLCGNGVGVSICANRFNGVRAVLAASPDFAQWGKQYDDCNVLCLASWHTKNPMLTSILDTWFATDFDTQPRRVARTKKMDLLS
jgi:ribose 5-phosphate isomerase B